MKGLKLLPVLFVLVALIGCSGVKVHELNSERVILAQDFGQLEDISDLILKAIVLPDKETVLETDQNGSVLFGYTLTRLEVTEVFTGDISVGGVVVITEEYWQEGSDVYTQANYLPAKEGNEYVFFLKLYGEDTRYRNMYFPIDLEKGKYTLNASLISSASLDSFSNAQLEVGAKTGSDYREWYKQVIEKYIRP